MAKPRIEGRTSTGLTRRHRRHGPVLDELGFASRFVSGRIQPEPATAAAAPHPFGNLDAAEAGRITEAAVAAWDGPVKDRRFRGRQTLAALEYLATFPGSTWQQRWDSSPLGTATLTANEVPSHLVPSHTLSLGVRTLLCLRVVRPSLMAFLHSRFHHYSKWFIAAQGDPLLDKFAEHVAVHDTTWPHRLRALLDVSCLLTVQGVSLGDVTPAALLHYAHDVRRVRTILREGKKDANQFFGIGVWDVLHKMGHFPADAPATMRAAMLRGQRTVAELVDRYPLANPGVRQLLIGYLTRRRADTDYSTLANLALSLAHHFWEKIEHLNPGQADLRIDPEVYATWREDINVRDDGQRRINVDQILIAVRSFFRSWSPTSRAGTSTPNGCWTTQQPSAMVTRSPSTGAPTAGTSASPTANSLPARTRRSG